MERKHLTASEKDGMFALAALITTGLNVEGIEQRIAMIPNGKAMLKGMQGMGAKLLAELTKTMLPHELEAFSRQLRGLWIDVGVKNHLRKGDTDNGTWLSVEQLNLLVAMSREHCLMCALDGQGQRQCPLRKLYDCLNMPGEDVGAKGCPYFAI